MQINPYLNFNGTCEAAFKFYEKVLGGKITAMIKAGDTPAKDDKNPGWNDKIIHAAMSVGGTTLMASDAPPHMFKPAQGLRITINVPVAEADKLYAALADGAEVIMPIAESFFAARFAMLNDKFGTPWMLTAGLK